MIFIAKKKYYFRLEDLNGKNLMEKILMDQLPQKNKKSRNSWIFASNKLDKTEISINSRRLLDSS